ncbi:hypothetical protein ABTN36_18630, partial [Acinetobacter baumannii]
QLHELCFVLQAEEAELVALTNGTIRFSGEQAFSEESLSAETIEQGLKQVNQQISRGEYRLIELELLLLKRQAWKLATKSAAGRHL